MIANTEVNKNMIESTSRTTVASEKQDMHSYQDATGNQMDGGKKYVNQQQSWDEVKHQEVTWRQNALMFNAE